MVTIDDRDIKALYFADKNSEPTAIYIDKEKQQVNPRDCLVQLQCIPSEKGKFIITELKEGKFNINSNTFVETLTGITKANQFEVYDRENGVLRFHSSMVGKNLVISYMAIGRIVYSADRIFTNTDTTGRILETLGDVLRNCERVLADINTLGDAKVIIDQTQANIDSLKNLNLDFKLLEGNDLKLQLDNRINTGKNLNEDLNSSIIKAERTVDEIKDWISSNGDISEVVVHLETKVDSQEYDDETIEILYPDIEKKVNDITNISIPSINKQLEDVTYYITPEMFGAKGDGSTDDTNALIECINFAKINKKTIKLTNSYYISETLTIDFSINIIGDGSNNTSIITDKDITILNLSSDIAKNGVYISNFAIKGSGQNNQIALDLMYITNGSHIENLRISNVGIGIKIRKSWYTSFNNIRINNATITGIDMKSIDGDTQVNNISFTSVNINASNQCVTAENTQLSSAINFIGCSFETSKLTACKFVNFRGLILHGCYFESNMDSDTVLTADNPIDIYIGGSGVNTTYSIIGCFFSRKNNFATSDNKVSIYCSPYTNGVVQTNFFKCLSSSYIDYNIYSDSSVPVEIIKNNQDGVAKNEYYGAFRRKVLAFKEVDLSSASNSTIYFPNNLNGTVMYASFIPTMSFTSSVAPNLRIFDGSTNETLQNISLGNVTDFAEGIEVVGVSNGNISVNSKLLKISTNQSASGSLKGYLSVYINENIIK